MRQFLMAGIALAAASVGLPALAQSVEPSFTAAVTSDYVFRGFSQTDEGPALQLGAELASGGFYGGVWGSNVDFGDGTDIETNIYAGYRTSAGGFDLDFGVTGFVYVGDPSGSGYDFVEFKASASREIGPATLGALVAWSPDFYGLDEKAAYYEANLGYGFAGAWSLSGAVGRQTLDVGADYTTWNVGLGYDFSSGVGVDLRYHDTDVNGPLSDQRLALTLSFSR